MGDEVDLTIFPAPMVHDGDGGRYLCTWHFVVNKDPESTWVNWGMYRQMIHNERLMGGLILPTSDLGKIKARYEQMGKPVPFASVISPDPLCATGSAVHWGVGADEVELAGALMQEPVQLVKCKTVDLEVPAHAEIILEGEILHGVEVEEGPFGEYTGYRSTPRLPRPVYKVNCITYRNNPILVMTNMGVPLDDGQVVWAALGVRTGIKHVLEHFGTPVTGVYVPPEGVGHIIIVGVRKRYNNIAMEVAQQVFGSPEGRASHILIVVDETTDPYNITEIMHAMATKCHPLNNVITYPAWGQPLSPYLSLRERTWGIGGRLVIDATWPVDWDPEVEKPVKSSFKTIYPKELQDSVVANWEAYGYR